MPGLEAHLMRAQSIALPAGRLPFWLGPAEVGLIDPDMRDVLLRCGCMPHGPGVALADPASSESFARSLAQTGHTRFRGEAFDVFAGDAAGLPRGAVAGQMDRGALALLGIAATGVHANGFVRRDGGLHLWVARRAAGVRLDPGKLDHIVAGGIPAGLSPRQTLIKEAAEEAGMPEALARQAQYGGALHYIELRPEGLRRDLLYVYDFDLPADFTPTPQDGEVDSFELWPIARVIDTLDAGDAFKFNVAYVLIDFAARMGALPPASPAYSLLAGLRRALPDPG